MISDVGAFLDWFAGVHRRTVRDVSILPAEAASWIPDAPTEGDEAWGIPKLVGHIAEARGYFASVYVGRGWVWESWPHELPDPASWVAALEGSMASLDATLRSAPPDRLNAKVELIADPGRTMSAWRALLMMAEHEAAHRAQIGTYAGLNGWPVAQIFDRTNEWVVGQRDEQRRRFRTSG